jgi:hypothetical protein
MHEINDCLQCSELSIESKLEEVVANCSNDKGIELQRSSCTVDFLREGTEFFF